MIRNKISLIVRLIILMTELVRKKTFRHSSLWRNGSCCNLINIEKLLATTRLNWHQMEIPLAGLARVQHFVISDR